MKVMDLTLFKQNTLRLLLACLVVSLSACDGLGRSTEEYIEGAQAYLDQKDFSAAVVELKSALQQDANSIEARKLLGDTYLLIGKSVDAEKEFRRAISLGMSPASGAIGLAHALLLQREFQQMLDNTIEPELLAKSDRAELLALLGDAYFGLNRLKPAERQYDASIAIDGSSLVALLGKARVAAARGDLDGAKAMAKKVADDNPTFAPAWEFLGDVEHHQGQLEEAEAMYSTAIKLSHYLSDSSVKRAGVRLEKEDYPGVKEDSDALIKSGYQSPHLFYFKGRVDFSNEAYPDAELAFKSALELSPEFWPAKVYLASTHLFLGQQQQALSLAQQLQTDAPADRYYLKGLLGATYANVGQFNQAKKSLNDLLTANPNDVYALSLLAQILLNEGQAEEAAAYLTRALSITPESKGLQYNLKVAKMMAGEMPDFNSTDYGEVFLRALAELNKGNYKKALDITQQLHRDNPTLVDPLNLSAAALLGLGDLSGATKAFEQVLQLEVNNPTAAKNLATMEWRTGNVEQAEEILSKYLIAYPQDESAVLKQAAIKMQLGKPDETTTLLRKALEQSPDSALIRLALAQHYFDAERYEELLTLTSNIAGPQFQAQPLLWELRGKVNLLRNNKVLAQEDFKTYATLLPQSAHAHFLYADVLSRMGKKAEARKELERAIKENANYLPARIGQVKMLVQHEELGAAKKAMTQLKQDFGELPAVLGLEGWLALGMGDLAGAERSLSAAIKQRPGSEASLLLFRSLWLQGKYEQAYAVLTTRLEQSPKELGLLEELAAAKMAQGKDSEALDIYLTVIEDHPNHVLALNNLAWLSRDLNLDQAITYAERASELAPQAAGVSDTLGELLLKKDSSSQRAFDLLQKAAKAAPDRPEIQLHYGTALLKRKMFTQARVVLNAIVTSSPGSATAAEATELLKGLPDAGG